MNEVLTRAEMEERFQGEWLLIADPEVNESLEVLRGRVVRHSPDRDEVYQAGVDLRLKHTASLYIGPVPEHVWLNEWKYSVDMDEVTQSELNPTQGENLDPNRLQRQIAFILEIDRLKSVLRRSYLVNDPRRENSAEHSWHLAVLAMTLAEHANAEVNVLRVLKMLLVHDVVEIDAGDTYCYDVAGNDSKAAREQEAARRIFGLLPDDQRDEMHELWEEFEARATPEAQFAAALDRLMPILHNYHTQGRSWLEHGVTRAQVLERNKHTGEGSDALWAYIETMIADAVSKGYLADTPEEVRP